MKSFSVVWAANSPRCDRIKYVGDGLTKMFSYRWKKSLHRHRVFNYCCVCIHNYWNPYVIYNLVQYIPSCCSRFSFWFLLFFPRRLTIHDVLWSDRLLLRCRVNVTSINWVTRDVLTLICRVLTNVAYIFKCIL